MMGTRSGVSVLGMCSIAGALGLAVSMPASAHNTAPPPSHTSSSHHVHNGAPGSGWHGYHHGYGFYGYWPWYFPVAYGYGAPYYGTTFLLDTPVTYVQMAPEDSGVVQPATSWYYCRNPEGYFPYVKTCPSGWQTVPIQPVPEPAPAK